MTKTTTSERRRAGGRKKFCAFVLFAGLALNACARERAEGTVADNDALPVYAVALTVATPTALPKCNAATAGTTAYVQSPAALWSCVSSVWIPLPCTKVLGGAVAYASATQSLWACVSGAWTPVALPTGPQGQMGAKGDPGAQGSTGAKGDPGATGSQGPPGRDGVSTLVATSPEPAGARCAAGGVRISVGPDANANGVLEDAELATTTFLCLPVEGAPADGGATLPADGGVTTPDPTAPTIARAGRRDRVLLKGTVVTPDVVFEGQVLVDGDTLACVAASCAEAPEAADATVVETKGIIFPGLIDTHNHVLFDAFDAGDWTPQQVYGDHDQWTNEGRYKALLDAKQSLSGSNNCELIKYGKLKALVAGTTSVVGSTAPTTNGPCVESLSRSIDTGANGLGVDKVQTATLFPNTAAADGVCSNFFSGSTNAYLVHVGEGVDAKARSEFARLGTITSTDECLYSPKTAIVHGTALGDNELTIMASHGMSLIWSPRSDATLYGTASSANVPLARAKGINVALGPNWSLTGSQNLLDELRFADHLDETLWGDVLTPKDLALMVTTNAARALGLGASIGSLEVGKKADVMVIGGDRTKPYDALLAATPKSVRLVMVGGVTFYGDSTLKPLGPEMPGCEDLSVCGGSKFVCVATPEALNADGSFMTLATIKGTLEEAVAAYDASGASGEYRFAPIAPLVSCSGSDAP